MKKNNINREIKEKEDIKDMLVSLEEQYRKANISEKDYKALKEKYSKRLGSDNMTKKDKAKKEEEIEEVTPEVIERLATQLSQQSETKETEEKNEGEKKPGLFGRLFGKKKAEKELEDSKEEKIVPETQPVEEQTISESQTYEEPAENYVETKYHSSETTKKVENLEVEIEKLKTIMETIREAGHVTEETIQTISEGIGELRSLVFQTDASLKETMVKMEKIEDDVAEVQPKEIVKKFREIDAEMEKHVLELEKMQTKIQDSNEKLNKMYEILKSIGGIENLVDINKKIQEKLKDVDEAVKYIGRIGAKTEKQFMDLSRGLEDLVIFKAKQEDLDESLKEILKTIDSLNIKFEGYVSKKDLDVFREDILLIRKQLDSVSKVLPLVDVKLPQEIIDLRNEREDILLLLNSLQEQYKTKKITKSEYMNFKEGNEKRMREIEKQLEKEWKKVERMTKSSEKERSMEQILETPIEEIAETKIEEIKPAETKIEEKKPEIKRVEESEKEKEDVKEKMEEMEEMFEKKKGKKFLEETEEVEKKEEELKPQEKEVVKEEPKKPEQKEKIEKKTKQRVKKSKKHIKNKPIKNKETGKMKILNEIKKMKI